MGADRRNGMELTVLATITGDVVTLDLEDRRLAAA